MSLFSWAKVTRSVAACTHDVARPHWRMLQLDHVIMEIEQSNYCLEMWWSRLYSCFALLLVFDMRSALPYYAGKTSRHTLALHFIHALHAA